jgi:hypothetical protein
MFNEKNILYNVRIHQLKSMNLIFLEVYWADLSPINI